MDRTAFINTLKETRAEWEGLLTQFDDTALLQPGPTEKWSVKDVIAHIAWSEREIAPVMRTRVSAGSDLWALPQDERNEIVFQQNRHRPLAEIVEEEQQTYEEILAAARTLSDEELNDPRLFKDMPSEWVPWQIFAGCTFRHYRDHMPSLQAWLAQSKGV